jgi:hypothetical protein
VITSCPPRNRKNLVLWIMLLSGGPTKCRWQKATRSTGSCPPPVPRWRPRSAARLGDSTYPGRHEDHESIRWAGMRGRFQDQGGLFSYISPERRVPANHPLRKIRELVREGLKELSHSLGKLYASEGRPSVPRKSCFVRFCSRSSAASGRSGN